MLGDNEGSLKGKEILGDSFQTPPTQKLAGLRGSADLASAEAVEEVDGGHLKGSSQRVKASEEGEAEAKENTAPENVGA